MFNLVIDDLIKRLRVRGHGCNLLKFFVRCILHADDVLLLYGSIVKLQKIIDICNEIGIECGFKFNKKI